MMVKFEEFPFKYNFDCCDVCIHYEECTRYRQRHCRILRKYKSNSITWREGYMCEQEELDA